MELYMKALKKSWWILVCVLLSIFGKAEGYAKEAGSVMQENEVGSLYAQSAVLMDGSSGRVLYEKNGEEFMANASTTKILTCILALENAELTDVVKVSSYAASMPDVQLHIREGEQYYLRDLLYSLMLESHNDVAVAIAEHISGSQEEFSKLMNRKAKEIGCKNTFFLTPNGLDATQKIRKDDDGERMQKNSEDEMQIFHGTTAADLALIMRYCIKISPKREQFLQITRTPAHSFQNVEKTRSFSCRNHNAFLNMMEGALSGKTGFTGNAGYCYVGALTRGDRNYIVALLACGWPNNRTYKWADSKKLMQYGIDNFEKASLEQVEVDLEKIGDIPVINGQGSAIGESTYTGIKLGIAKGETELLVAKGEEIKVVYQVKQKLGAPVEADLYIGKVCIIVGEEILREYEVLTTEAVAEIDFFWCVKMVWKLFLNGI